MYVRFKKQFNPTKYFSVYLKWWINLKGLLQTVLKKNAVI